MILRKDKKTPLPAGFCDKVRQFLAYHERIVAGFEQSLNASGHFLKLAEIAAQKETENTIAMLEQIQTIGLRKNIEQQQNGLEAMENGLRQRLAVPQSEQTHPLLEQFYDVQEKYHVLGREARMQEEHLDDFQAALGGRNDA